MSEDKISRRKYLKYAGAAVGIGAIAAAGYGISQYYQAPTPTTSPTTPTSTPTTGKKTVKIGGTKPITGAEALPGRAEYNGNELWAKVVNEAGGIKAGDGNTYEVELILYSDESKPENVPRLYEKLITEDKVDLLLGPVWGPLGMATVPMVEKYRKFEVYGTCSFDPRDYRDWKYIVHTITNGPYYMASILDMIKERVVPYDPEAKNIAIIHGDDAFRATVGTYGKEYAEELGFNVVSYDTYTWPGTTDLTPLLSKAKAAKPAILLNPGSYADAIITIKNMKDLDFNIKMVWAGTGVVYPKYYETLGKYAEGSVTCTQWEKGMIYRQDYGPSHDEFIDMYQKDYGDIPDYVVATGFQQGLVIQRAMELCDDPLNSDAMRKVAGEMEMNTFYGKYKVDPVTGWQIGHKMGVVQWQNGQKQVVWPMEANPGELWYPLPPWSEM